MTGHLEEDPSSQAGGAAYERYFKQHRAQLPVVEAYQEKITHRIPVVR